MYRRRNTVPGYRKVISQRKLQLVIQKDYIYGTRYQSWSWNGIGYQEGLGLIKQGWTWQKGPQGGVWTTNLDENGTLAEEAAAKCINAEIIKIGNGWGE